jgi:hypothetical protein
MSHVTLRVWKICHLQGILLKPHPNTNNCVYYPQFSMVAYKQQRATDSLEEFS